MATLHDKIIGIEPESREDVMAIIKGELKTFAVHLEYDAANMDYNILKVEPWDAYEHVNAESRRIYQVADRDELGAYVKMRNFLDDLLGEE